MRRPCAGKGRGTQQHVVGRHPRHRAKMHRASHERRRDEQPARRCRQPARKGRQRGDEKTGRETKVRQRLGVERRGRQVQQVIKNPFSQRLHVEEDRAGMMKPPARIAAVEFCEVLGADDGERVRGKVPVLVIGPVEKEICAVGNDGQDDAQGQQHGGQTFHRSLGYHRPPGNIRSVFAAGKMTSASHQKNRAGCVRPGVSCATGQSFSRLSTANLARSIVIGSGRSHRSGRTRPCAACCRRKRC